MVSRHGFDPDAIGALLAQARYRQVIVDAMERPYESMPWHRYRKIFLTQERLAAGLAFWRANADALDRARTVYGVSPEVVVAIVGVETSYGEQVGDHRVLDALTTLGFAYPKRGAFFRGELESFLLLQREEGLDPVLTKGSYAGALGKPQFIPSSYRAFAVDFDGDGRRDLWGSDADTIGSVANYFRAHGWRAGEPVALRATLKAAVVDDVLAGVPVADKSPVAPNTTAGQLRAAGVEWLESAQVRLDASLPATLIELDGEKTEYWVGLANFYAITRYNHSNLYAMAVHQLSLEIRARHSEGV
jgi:membrane-bound lytic murein transglycosylase B